MKKKRTLNQTWTLCLRMWKWVSEMKTKNSRRWVSSLKKQWLRENKIRIKGSHDCFFCEYTNNSITCWQCPGNLVDPSFNCSRKAYHYTREPVAFYKELLRLNRIRKGKK